MKHVLFVVVVVSSVFALTITAWSKGLTLKIEIRGDHLTSPIEITNPNVVSRFNIWNGPGVRVNNVSVHMDPSHQAGGFIDWPKGAVLERPAELHHYEVSFHIKGRRPPHNRYLVVYEFEPSKDGGYIFLPGRGDAHYRANIFLIDHGIEGNWFFSSSAWEGLVRPIIENQLRSR